MWELPKLWDMWGYLGGLHRAYIGGYLGAIKSLDKGLHKSRLEGYLWGYLRTN